jgi:hypothetical protein
MSIIILTRLGRQYQLCQIHVVGSCDVLIALFYLHGPGELSAVLACNKVDTCLNRWYQLKCFNHYIFIFKENLIITESGQQKQEERNGKTSL